MKMEVNSCVTFSVMPANERKTEEEYFTEAISRDDIVVTIQNRLSNDSFLPLFHVSVCIFIRLRSFDLYGISQSIC